VLDALVNEAQLRWGLDLARGLQVVTVERILATPIEPSRPAIVAPRSKLGQVGAGAAEAAKAASTAMTASTDAAGSGDRVPDLLPGRHGPGRRAPLVLLRGLYPPEHAVGRFGVVDATTIDALDDGALHGGIYLGPVSPEHAPTGPWALPWISWRLREPDGCPWDREQTHESLRRHLLEEAYEVYDALGEPVSPALAGELGDLLLQVVLHAQLAAEEGAFDLADVQRAIGTKIVRRHPHVFGDAEARTASDVNRQWEQIKRAERAGDESTVSRSALDGISRSMPALAASQEMQERASHLGYDWPTVEGIVAKVREELGELLDAETDPDRREEVGDLLMVVVNLARRHGVEAETALRGANDKFRRRFGTVERLAAARGVALRDLDFDALDALWDAAKAEERAT
jgi:tetrapyrrole methylase family protein/MazG family protein